MLKILSLIVGELGVNCYIPYCEQTRQCVVIDPGGSVDRILGLIKENNLQLKYILLTHGHFDHIGAVNELKENRRRLQCILKIQRCLWIQPKLILLCWW